MKKNFLMSFLLVFILFCGGFAVAAPFNNSEPMPGMTGPLATLNEFAIMPGGSLTGNNREYDAQVAFLTQAMKDAGFNFTNFARPEHLATIKKVGGLLTIVKMTADKTDWHYNAGSTMPTMSAETIQQKAKTMVDVCKPYEDIVAFYYIVDEPSTDKFPKIKEVKDALSALNPQMPSFVNFYPQFALAKTQLKVEPLDTASNTYRSYLNAYRDTVGFDGFIRYDNFNVLFSNEDYKEGKMRDYLENLMVVREYGQKYKLPMWNTGAACQIRQATALSPAMPSLNLQAYTTLAAGYKGMGWYIFAPGKAAQKEDGTYGIPYPNSPYDPQVNELTQTWYMVKDINRQLKVLGNRMLRMTSDKVFYKNLGAWASAELPESSGGDVVKEAVANTPLMVGEFTDTDGSRWVMVVNLSFFDTATVKLTLQEGFSGVEVFSQATGKLKKTDVTKAFYLAPGMGRLVKVLK